MVRYRCSRGLDIVKKDNLYYIIDCLGNEQVLSCKSEKNISDILLRNFNIHLIVDEEYCNSFLYNMENIFNILENYGSKIFLKSENDIYTLPIACSTLGYGEGGIDNYDFIEDFYKDFNNIDLIAGYNYYDLQKLYDDFYSLIHRGVNNYSKLIIEIREVIKQNSIFEINEIKPIVYETSWLIVNCIISFSSALDVAAKLSKFIELIDTNFNKIYLQKVNSLNIDFNDLNCIDKLSYFVELPIFKSLRKIRNDLIHNIGTIEIERNQYLGFGTSCINNHRLCYLYIPMRDVDENGSLKHKNGRKYFTSQENDMDVFLSSVLKNMNFFVREFQKYVVDTLKNKAILRQKEFI